MAMLADTSSRHRGRHPQAHAHRCRGRGCHRRHARPGDRAGHPGYRQLLALADRQHGRRVWAIEGTGGYGAGLTRYLHGQAEQVGSWTGPSGPPAATAPVRPLGRGQGGPRGLGRDRLAQPRRPVTGRRCRCGWPPDARRFRPPPTQRQLHALVVAAPDSLRGRLRGLTTPRLVRSCGRLRQRTTWDVETARHRGQPVCAGPPHPTPEHRDRRAHRAITTLVRAWRPDLLTPTGVGPMVAAIVLCAVPCRPLPHRCRLRHAGWGRPHPASSGRRSGCG